MRALPVDANKQWKRKDARRVVAAWRRSGVSQRVFAAEHGLSRQRLCYWNSRLNARKSERCAAQSTEPRFAPAVVVDAGAAVSIRVRNAMTIEISTPARVAPEWLAEFVGRLAERKCS